MEQIIITMFLTGLGVVIHLNADNEFANSVGVVMMWIGIITLITLFFK